jgi:glycosyltransferase involved in cell wall biosynthesis
MNVVLLGVYPPPIGGVSIHLQRFGEFLLEHGHSVQVLDYPGAGDGAKPAYVFRLPQSLPGKLWFIYRFARQQPDGAVVHFHTAAMGRFRWIAPFLFFAFRKQTKFLTLHSGLFTGEIKRQWIKIYLRRLLNRCDHVIPVTHEIADYLVEIDIRPEHLTVIPAYIAKTPQVELLPAKLAALKPTHKLVLAAGFLMHEYNFDVLLDVMPQLDPEQFHFVFVFYADTDPAYEADVLGRLERYDNVTILRNQPSDVFLSILHACDICVRTTVKDGDAITIREALDFGVTVFATDCVARPEDCYLFRHDDPASLHTLFSRLPTIEKKEQRVAHISNAQRLVDLYETVASERTARR